MTDSSAQPHRAEPDSLVALVPVAWSDDEVDILSQFHPDIWAEPLVPVDAPAPAAAGFSVGDVDAHIGLFIDEALPDLADMAGMAKQPFTSSEAIQLQQHDRVWRLVMDEISAEPITRAHAFARLLATAIEAGAPGVFLPFCLQLHSPRLIKHLAVDFSQPQALINLYVNAWNDDQWMVTRGLTVFGLPELETSIESGLNDAYFRLMDVAANMLIQRDPYPSGATLQLGPDHFVIEKGPLGPEDTMVPISGVFGRLTIARPD